MRKLVSGIIMVTFSLLVMTISVNAQSVKQHQPGQSLTITRAIELHEQYNVRNLRNSGQEFAYKITANTTLSKPGFSIVASANSANPKAKTLISEITSLKAGAGACTDTTLLAPGASCTLYLKADFTKAVVGEFDDTADLTICPSTDPSGPQFDCASVPTTNKRPVKIEDKGEAHISVASAELKIAQETAVAMKSSLHSGANVGSSTLAVSSTGDAKITPTVPANSPWSGKLTFTPASAEAKNGEPAIFNVTATAVPSAIDQNIGTADIKIEGVDPSDANEVTNTLFLKINYLKSGLTFAPVEVTGQTFMDEGSKEGTVKLTNYTTAPVTLGTCTMNISDAGQPQNLDIGTGCDGKTLQAGASCTVTLKGSDATTTGVSVVKCPATSPTLANAAISINTAVAFQGPAIDLERVQCPGDTTIPNPYIYDYDTNKLEWKEKVCVRNNSTVAVNGVEAYISDNWQVKGRNSNETSFTKECSIVGSTAPAKENSCPSLPHGGTAVITLNGGGDSSNIFGELHIAAKKRNSAGQRPITTYDKIVANAVYPGKVGVFYPENQTASQGMAFTFRNETTSDIAANTLGVDLTQSAASLLEKADNCIGDLAPKAECTISLTIKDDATPDITFAEVTPTIVNASGLISTTVLLGNASTISGQMRPAGSMILSGCGFAAEAATGVAGALTTGGCNGNIKQVVSAQQSGEENFSVDTASNADSTTGGRNFFEIGDVSVVNTASDSDSTRGNYVLPTPISWVSLPSTNVVGTTNEGGDVDFYEGTTKLYTVTSIDQLDLFCPTDTDLTKKSCHGLMVAKMGNANDNLYSVSYQLDPSASVYRNGEEYHKMRFDITPVDLGQDTAAADIKIASVSTDGLTAKGVIAVKSTGDLTTADIYDYSWNTANAFPQPREDGQVIGLVNAAVCEGTTCFVGGVFTVAGTNIEGLAKIDLSAATPSLAKVTNFTSGTVNALVYKEDNLEVGGIDLTTTSIDSKPLIYGPAGGTDWKEADVSGNNITQIATLDTPLTKPAPTKVIFYTGADKTGAIVAGKVTLDGSTFDDWLYNTVLAGEVVIDNPTSQQSFSFMINSAAKTSAQQPLNKKEASKQLLALLHKSMRNIL